MITPLTGMRILHEVPPPLSRRRQSRSAGRISPISTATSNCACSGKETTSRRHICGVCVKACSGERGTPSHDHVQQHRRTSSPQGLSTRSCGQTGLAVRATYCRQPRLPAPSRMRWPVKARGRRIGYNDHQTRAGAAWNGRGSRRRARTCSFHSS